MWLFAPFRLILRCVRRFQGEQCAQIAAALSFAQEGDAQAAELQKLVKERGAETALDVIAQLRPWNPVSKLIREAVKQQTS